MKKKQQEDNPYLAFTLDEVENAESNHWYVQVDGEVAFTEGRYTHSKDTAERIFWSLLDSLVHMKENGDPEEMEDAHKCLLNLRLHKLRIH